MCDFESATVRILNLGVQALPEEKPKLPEPQEVEVPNYSAAFEEAVKKLAASADAAGQFKAITDNTAPESKAAVSALSSSASTKVND